MQGQAPAGLAQSAWLRVAVGSLLMAIGFLIFYGAIPSALIAWTDNWTIIEDHPDIAPRIRDVGIIGYHGLIVNVTFLAFSLYQRLNPVNADADEGKRDPGGYR